MDAVGFAGAHAAEHLVAELGGLMTQLDDTLADKTLDPFPDLPGGGSGGLVTGEADLLLFGKADQLHAEGLGHGDLEEMHVVGEASGELFPGGNELSICANSIRLRRGFWQSGGWRHAIRRGHGNGGRGSRRGTDPGLWKFRLWALSCSCTSTSLALGRK
jgi:hypothetical protein